MHSDTQWSGLYSRVESVVDRYSSNSPTMVEYGFWILSVFFYGFLDTYTTHVGYLRFRAGAAGEYIWHERNPVVRRIYRSDMPDWLWSGYRDGIYVIDSMGYITDVTVATRLSIFVSAKVAALGLVLSMAYLLHRYHPLARMYVAAVMLLLGVWASTGNLVTLLF